MKKSIAVILLGSALLLPNNNNVEASYSNNNVLVQKVQDVKQYGWGNKQFYSYNAHKEKRNGGYRHNWKKYNSKNKEVASPVKPVEKPSTPKPAPTPTPAPTPAPTPTPTPTPAQDTSISAIEKAVLDLTNVERQKAGLKALQTDSKLMESARAKSTDMATKKYFSHTSPTYGSPFDQMKTFGITYKSAAENIAMGQRSAEEVVKAWMESPGHRENIMNPSLTHIGIGYDKNGNYWTQQFIGK